MKVLWTHNFNPAKQNAGIFMYNMANGVSQFGIDINFEYLGNLRSPYEMIKAYRRLKKVALEYDIIHAQFGSACAFVTSFIRNTPKVVTLRGSDWNVYSESFGFYYLHTRLARVMSKLSLKRFDCIITVSNRMKNEIEKYHACKNCIDIPSPIDLEKFLPKDKSMLRKKFNSSDQEKWILFNSNNLFKPIKRYNLAKSAIELAQKQNNNIKLRIASGIPFTDIPDFVSSCDLILCTSTAEGWPNSIKEALACNVPFVSTDVSDLDIIAKQEKSCYICKPNPINISEAIISSLSNPKNYNLRKYVELMNIEVISKKLYNLYKSVVSNNKLK